VPTDAALFTVRPYDHGHGVPSNDRLDAPLDFIIAGKWWLIG
jgi:hypothetical protein